MQRKVVILGDSHVAVLKTAWSNLGRTTICAARDLDLQFKPLGSARSMTKPFATRTSRGVIIDIPGSPSGIVEIEADPSLVAVGLSVLHPVRMLRLGGWHKYAPIPIATREYGISNAVLTQVIEDDQRHTLDLVDALQAAGIFVFGIEAPRMFRGHAGMDVVRAEVWTAVAAAFDRVAGEGYRKRNVHIVRVPKSLLDDDGFMLERYCRATFRGREDRHHGNEEFASIMLERTLQYLSGLWLNPDAGES